MLVILRLLIPVEFRFAQTIAVKQVFPTFCSFLYLPILNVIGKELSVLHIFLVVWGIGSFLLFSKMIINYWIFNKLICQKPFISSPKIFAIIKNLESNRLRPANFKVIETDLISVPIVFGLFHPIILIPEIQLSNSELTYILKHEITHYYNHDILIKLLSELITIIYWWNPMIYLLKKDIDKVLEIRVDSSLIKILNDTEKIEYLECLLKIAKNGSNDQSYHFLPTFGANNVSELSQRFLIILNSNIRQRSKIVTSLLLTFIITIVLVSSSIILEPYSINPNDMYETIELTAETSYLVKNLKGGYDVYINNNYFATVTEIKNSYSDLSVYNNLQEVQYNEKKQ
ncbi:M56 family metallopeptidase [Candidatus Galacturonibacter soehngenii]|nr:M56 family metallopeptidase [Candidatus Galacturonibacter soehngenii]